MRCVHCSKEISLLANVCPFCDRDTAASKEESGRVMLWSILACGAGYLAGKVFGVEAGFATFFGVLVFGAATTPKVKTPPRNVRVVD